MSDKYLEIEYADPEQERVVEEMRQGFAKQFGVTVVGQFVTVRWSKGKQMRSVTMVITDVDDGVPVVEDTEDK